MPEPANKKRNRVILWSVIIGVTVVIVAFSAQFDLKELHDWTAGMNGWIVFLMLAVLPLVGMPVSILCVMAGARFGSWGGMLVVLVTIAFHLVASRWIVRSWLRKLIDRLLLNTQYKMPLMEAGDYVGVCLLTALVPGPSYVMKNYFLALSNMPFRIIFLVTLPAHLFAVSPGILFGNFSGALSAPKIVFLVVYVLTLVVVSRHLVSRLRARKRRAAPSAEAPISSVPP